MLIIVKRKLYLQTKFCFHLTIFAARRTAHNTHAHATTEEYVSQLLVIRSFALVGRRDSSAIIFDRVQMPFGFSEISE